jgi:homeobox protein cut-like
MNDDEAGRKYAGQYENQLDPFAKFSKSEKQRKYASLSPIDKFSLNMGQFILGNKVSSRHCRF